MRVLFLAMRSNKVIIALLLFLAVACKKDDGNPSGSSSNSNDVELTLVDDHLYHLGVGVIESDKSIETFGGKISISGIEIDAVKASDKSIAFGISESIPVGAQKLSISINNEATQELAINIAALPAVSNPEQVLVDYKVAIEDLNQTTQALFDSTSARYNIQADPNVDLNLDALNDSLRFYIDAFNAASPEEKMIAAKVLNAQLLDVKDLIKSMKENMFLMTISSGFGKKASVCEDLTFNTSEAWQCVLSEFRSNMIALMVDCSANWVIGGTVGGVFGALATSGFGVGVGAAIGINVANFFNAISLFNFLKANVCNLKGALVVTAQNIFNKASLSFENDAYTPINYRVARRNIQSGDATSAVAFVKDYVEAYSSFVGKIKEYFPDKIAAIPGFQSLSERAIELEDVNYLSFEVKGNSKVNFIDMQGDASKPELMFTTDEITDQNFTLVVNYDDGVFKLSEEFDAVLAGELETWFSGTYELLSNPNYPNECSSTKAGSKGQVYFLAYEKVNGNPGVITYFKSVLPEIPDVMSAYGSFNLKDGVKEYVYLYEDLWYVRFSDLEYKDGQLNTAANSSAYASYVKQDHFSGSPNGCGGTGFDFWYGVKVNATESNSSPGGLSPTEIQAMRDMRE